MPQRTGSASVVIARTPELGKATEYIMLARMTPLIPAGLFVVAAVSITAGWQVPR